MLELHQFRHSAFCEKVRLLLAAKQLPYSVVEVVPGLGQVQLYRLSGQRQVPVLVTQLVRELALMLALQLVQVQLLALQVVQPVHCDRCSRVHLHE
jgi:glutathione S-transferase